MLLLPKEEGDYARRVIKLDDDDASVGQVCWVSDAMEHRGSMWGKESISPACIDSPSFAGDNILRGEVWGDVVVESPRRRECTHKMRSSRFTRGREFSAAAGQTTTTTSRGHYGVASACGP